MPPYDAFDQIIRIAFDMHTWGSADCTSRDSLPIPIEKSVPVVEVPAGRKFRDD